MNRFFKMAVIALGLVLLVPASAGAHGSNFTYKYMDGDNFVHVTHNVHHEEAGLPITYNLRLYNMDGQLIPFQEVEARVLHGAKSVHYQKVSASLNGDAFFTYTFPKKGAYVLHFHFLDNDKEIARGQFPVNVEAGVNESFFSGMLTPQAALTFVLGAGVGAAAVVYRRPLLSLPKRLKSVAARRRR